MVHHDFKLYHKATASKICDTGKKQTDWYNRTEGPVINLKLCGELIHNKEGKNIQWEKDNIPKNDVEKFWMLYV